MDKTICINCIENEKDCVVRKSFTDIHKIFPEIIYTFTMLKCPNYKTENDINKEKLSCRLPDGEEHECPLCKYMTIERLCPKCNTCVTCDK